MSKHSRLDDQLNILLITAAMACLAAVGLGAWDTTSSAELSDAVVAQSRVEPVPAIVDAAGNIAPSAALQVASR